MEFLKIAGLQMKVTTDVKQNEAKIDFALQAAAEDGADFFLTPEGALSGYTPHFNASEVAEAVERVTALAKKSKVGLALGTCYKEGGKCWNQIRVSSPEGEFLGAYSKVLRCSPVNAPGTGEMKEYAEGTLRTFDWNGVRFGTLICNDLWATPGFTTIPNPYLPLKLKEMGAQVILHAVNSGSDQRYRDFHKSSVELWAMTLGLPIVSVSALPEDNTAVNAPSGVVGRTGERMHSAPETGEQYFTFRVKL